jgi:GT2 family glycosyltransferase
VYSSLLSGNYVPVGTTIFRRDAAEKVGLYDEAFRLADDRDFYLRLSRVGRFAYYPRVVHRKRVHGENLTHAKNREGYRRSQLLVLRKMLRMAKELGLSTDEVRATGKAIGEQGRIMLYHASERGVGAYLEMCGFLWRQRVRDSVVTPRDWVRAAAFSTVLEKRFR